MEGRLTPAMHQFIENKKKHPDCVIFFRMGDFYETFFEDAKVTAKTLDITLTKRGGAPLAGIPYHALDPNLAKMIKAGHKVAICEQIEDPKKVKGRIVKRAVIRIVTPGTLIEPNLLDENKNNYIMSVYHDEEKGAYSIALADISTGEFFVSECENKDQLMTEITRFEPAEIVVSEKQEIKTGIYTTNFDEDYFGEVVAYKTLIMHFDVSNLHVFGIEGKGNLIKASGALIAYLDETQKGIVKQINRLRYFKRENFMILDRSTIRNLELFNNIRDSSKRGSLISILDLCVTAMGSRMLRNWISQPLLDKNQILERQDAVSGFINQTLCREEVRELLDGCYDIERLISRVSQDQANPKDVIAIKDTLLRLPKIKDQLSVVSCLLVDKIKEMREFPEIVNLISEAILDNPATKIKEGGIIKDGYNKDLDELRDIIKNGKSWIKNLENEEKEKTGIPTLRIGYNRVHGYYIEVTRRFQDQVPENYIRRQTLANCERYITDDLKQKEGMVLGAEEKINNLEFELFNEVIAEIKKYIQEMQEIGRNLAILDVIISLSSCAVRYNFVKPEIALDDVIEIKDGRHPVIERLQTDPYIPNDVFLNKACKMMIITGPNMSGKSSLMRQVALIQLMSQIGSFIPARFAKIGICDRIFTRVGAYDDLTMGQSTFMVEMSETASILHNASDKSLIIIDEIGRGTSTFDGIALAWSIAKYINCQIRAKTLFATHFHQLNNLAERYSEIKNYNIAIKEVGDEIIFLRKLVAGGTDKSYGVQVAKLAGLPLEVIEHSKDIMKKFEVEDRIGTKINRVMEQKVKQQKLDGF